MESGSEGIICGVCSKLISDPYKLPCGHTFCLRPCLLAHAKSVKARCIYCHLEFCASELRQDFSVGAKLYFKLSKELQMENNGETTKPVDSRNRNGQIQCSACRKPMEAEQLDYCQHCYRSVCPLCLVKHFNSFSLSLRVKLTSLARQKLSLSSKLQQLKEQSRTQVVSSQPTSKDTIVAEVDGAIAQLNRAVSDALDNAMSKLELLDDEGSRKLNEISERLLADCCSLDDIHDINKKLEGNQMKLQDLAKTFQRLKSIHDGAALTDSLPVLPITLLEVSKRFYKIIEDVAEFNLLVLDDPASLSTIISQRTSCDRVDVGKALISKVKLYVGGLRATHTEEHLKNHFERSYGPLVDCYVARDYKTKVSRCYGFVTFKEPVHAARALEDFPHFIEGTPVRVHSYRIENVEKNKPSTKNKGNSKTESPSRQTDELRLFVGNISPSVEKESLKEYFSKYGNVARVNVILERGSGKPRGIAFVHMTTKEDVKAVLDKRPHSIGGKQLIVRPAYAKDSEWKATEENVPVTADSQLIIHDIPIEASRQDLLKCFSTFGGITSLRIDDKGRVGFLTFSSAEAAKLALQSSPHQISGKYLRVSLVKLSISSPSEPSLEIQVGDISSSTSSHDLIMFFAQFGGVLKANVVTKGGKRFGFVKMSSFEAVKNAVNAKAPKIKDNYVTIRAAFSKQQAISHRSRVRLAKTNKKLSEIATTDESVIFSPLQLQEISIPVPSQKQPIIRYD